MSNLVDWDQPAHKTYKYGTKEYSCWVNIHERCNNKRHSTYKHYGAKGIRVSEDWNTYERFLEDTGLAPSREHIFVRVDSSKDYGKGNGTWITYPEMLEVKLNTKQYRNNDYDIALKSWS